MRPFMPSQFTLSLTAIGGWLVGAVSLIGCAPTTAPPGGVVEIETIEIVPASGLDAAATPAAAFDAA